MIWTEEYNLFNSPVMKTSFIASKEQFIDNPKRGLEFLKRNVIPYLGAGKVYASQDIIYQYFDYLQKYKDSKILIIGAGPSTESANFKEEDYDFVWSCNHFFKNEKIKNMYISLTTISDEVDVKDPELISYLEENETLICFENRNTGLHAMSFLKSKFPNRVFWALTRYHSRIGTVPRLACLAIIMGAKEVHFVGMDGHVPKKLSDKYKNSCFEVEKEANGSLQRNTNKEGHILELYKEQYLTFWDYILHDIGKPVKFKNLGENHPCNSSDIVLKEKIGKKYPEYLMVSRE